MRDVRVALGLEEALRPAPFRHAHAREVVAAEVDEHDVLGAVFLGGEQPLGVAVARRRRPGDRVQARARGPRASRASRARSRRAPARGRAPAGRGTARGSRGAEHGRGRPASPTWAAPPVGRGRSGTRRPRRSGASPRRRTPRSPRGREPRRLAARRGGARRAPRPAARAARRPRPGRPRAPRRSLAAWSKRTSVSAMTNRLSGRSAPVSGSGTVGSITAMWS